jgi:hypothetical protein
LGLDMIKLSLEEYAKCREFLRFCVVLSEIIDVVASLRTGISTAELYDLLDSEVLRRNFDLAKRILLDAVDSLVKLDENLGEMKHVIIKHNVPVGLTVEGVAELTAHLITLHAVAGCQI